MPLSLPSCLLDLPPSLPLPHSFSLHPSYISPPLPPPFKLLQISAVGELSRGSSLITFYILNGTDVTSDPTFVEAGLIDMAFRASNVQEVDSYPVSISGEDQTKSIKWVKHFDTHLWPYRGLVAGHVQFHDVRAASNEHRTCLSRLSMLNFSFMMSRVWFWASA